LLVDYKERKKERKKSHENLGFFHQPQNKGKKEPEKKKDT